MGRNDIVARQVGEIFRRFGRFAVISHKNPDGDAIGSSLAVYLVLKKMGKDVIVVNPNAPDSLPENYSFLPGYGDIGSIGMVDDGVEVIVSVDVAEFSRCGLSQEQAENKVIVNIDHHDTNPCFGTTNLVDSGAGSVGCILFDIFKSQGFPIDRDVAVCLYTSILTDTGSFRYSSTTPETLRVSAELLEYGVDPWFVAYNVYETKSFSSVRLLSLALSTLELFHGGLVCFMYITKEMFEQTGTTPRDTEGFVNFARGIRGVEVGVLLREDEPEHFKVSMRSKGGIDVSRVALEFGGGVYVGRYRVVGCMLVDTGWWGVCG